MTPNRSKPSPATERGYGGRLAAVVHEALRFQIHEPRERTVLATHLGLLADWRRALTEWAAAAEAYHAPLRLDVMRDCPSCLVRCRGLRSGRRGGSSCCRMRWLCPWCYGREIVHFLRPFRRRQFDVVHRAEVFRDPKTAWQAATEETQELLRYHGAVACWRTVYPAYNGWQSHFTWLHPAPRTFDENFYRLAEGFAYPQAFLWFTRQDVDRYLEFLSVHRGRTVLGLYHDRKQPHAKPRDICKPDYLPDAPAKPPAG